MFYFVTWKVDGQTQIRQFSTIEKVFEWLQHLRDESGPDLPDFAVFKAECLYDGT